MRATTRVSLVLSVALACVTILETTKAQTPETLHVGFLWHMHQPIYYPGENILQTNSAGHFSFSLLDVHNQRLGPYTTWPRDAVQAGLGLSHLGAQVSFSGSLIENLNHLESAGINGGQWNNWEGAYKQAINWQTSEGNPRLDMVGFGYHHPLMPLLDQRDMRMQIKLHKEVHNQTWGPGVPYSKGIFPAETAFSSRMIPALKAEGLEWTMFDSIHLERAVENYPHTNSSNLFAPNRADQINPALPANEWIQLNNLWAPSKVAAPFAYRPHYTQYVDPSTGTIEKIVAVPAARYEGNEDGRGGFGALQYEQVMSQYLHLNTDPNHPMFVLLHHDGDNFGGGSESYYHGNFQNMVNWASNNSSYDVTTVQDYLDRFPVDPNDVVHIEAGSWAGADNGDPEFKKWLGDPDPSTGWSPDRNSWAVLTAAKNRVYTAHDIELGGPNNFPNIQNVINGSGSQTEQAWHYLLQAQASDHWYWDGTEIWDSNVTRGSNLAAAEADQVINNYFGVEQTPPTVFLPQRESYNPGGFEWGSSLEPSDFEVWTYAYDVSGLQNVTLKYRVDGDGENPLSSTQNETYAGGSEVGAWVSVPMSSSDVAPPGGILAPSYRALRFGGMITGIEDSLVDYYVEAVDANGNIQRTDIQHVYVGESAVVGGDQVTLTPETPVAGQSAGVSYDPSGGPLTGAGTVYGHVGYDNWSTVEPIDAPLTWDPVEELWNFSINLPSDVSQLDLVFNDGAGTWDNNGGADWHFAVTGGDPPAGFTMDGQLDASAQLLVTENGQSLYWALEGDKLYLATEDAGEGSDVFLYVAEQPGALTPANWAKSGSVAAWDAFLADENDNDYETWTGTTASAEASTGANGGVLEGVIDLGDEFGALIDELYVAVALFSSPDGGSLVQVLGAMNANGSVEANEYHLLTLSTPPLPGDANGDGVVDLLDLDLLGANFGLTSGATFAQGDFNGDGAVDLLDLDILGGNFGASSAATVPEPHSAWFAILAIFLFCCSLQSPRQIRGAVVEDRS